MRGANDSNFQRAAGDKLTRRELVPPAKPLPE